MNRFLSKNMSITLDNRVKTIEELFHNSEKILSYVNGDIRESDLNVNKLESQTPYFLNMISFVPPKEDKHKHMTILVGDGIYFYLNNKDKWVCSSDLWRGDSVKLFNGEELIVNEIISKKENEIYIIEDILPHNTFFINGILSSTMKLK
jgi:hypothetical protein